MDAQDFVERTLAAMQPAPKRLLEISAGSGSFLRQLTSSLNVYGLGIDPFASDYQSDNLAIRRLTAEKIGSLKQWFDVVFSIHSLHHFS